MYRRRLGNRQARRLWSGGHSGIHWGMTRQHVVEQLRRAFAPLLADKARRAQAIDAWRKYCELCDAWATTTTHRHPSELPAWLSEKDCLAASWVICLRYAFLAKIRLRWLPVKGEFAKPAKNPRARDQVHSDYWQELDPTLSQVKLALSIVTEACDVRLRPLVDRSEEPRSLALRRAADAVLDVLVLAGHLSDAYDDARGRAEHGSRPHATDLPEFRRPREAALKRRHAQIDAAYQNVPHGDDDDWSKHADFSKLGPEALNDAIILAPTPWADLADEMERTYRNLIIKFEEARAAVDQAALWLDAGEPRPLQRPSVLIKAALARLLGFISPIRVGDDGMGLLRGGFEPWPAMWATTIGELGELRCQVVQAAETMDQVPGTGETGVAHSATAGPSVVVNVVQRSSANTRALELLNKNPGFANQPARAWQRALGLKSEGAVRHLPAWKNRVNIVAPRRARGEVPVDEIAVVDNELRALINDQKEDMKTDTKGWDRRGGV